MQRLHFIDMNVCDYAKLFLPRDATQSAVMPQYVVCLSDVSVCPSVTFMQVP